MSSADNAWRAELARETARAERERQYQERYQASIDAALAQYQEPPSPELLTQLRRVLTGPGAQQRTA